jgi:hypothetical protein
MKFWTRQRAPHAPDNDFGFKILAIGKKPDVE